MLDLRDKPSLQQPVRKLTEARFASDRLPSSSVDSLSSSSRSSETLMASVTTEMLRGGSVSFQPSGAYAQHTACCQTYCEMACTPFHCKMVRFVFQLRTPPTPVTPSALKDRTVHRPSQQGASLASLSLADSFRVMSTSTSSCSKKN